MNQRHSKPTRWLVTGGAGFIGCNLIKHLIAKDIPFIRILDNLSIGSRADLACVCKATEINYPLSGSSPEIRSRLDSQNYLPSPISPGLLHDHASVVELVVGDIRDPDLCLWTAQNIDVIVHLAANTGVAPSVENPRFDMEVNVVGTLNMLEAARQNGVRRFIFASSGVPIGECNPPIHEELAPHPVSPYGASKLAGEGYCSAYYRTFEIDTVSLRFGNVYGPLSRHKSSIIAKFIHQTLVGEPCEIHGDGHQTRDFIFIDDLAIAIIKAAVGNAAGKIFQIATNKEHTINEVASMLAQELSKYGFQMKVRHGDFRLGDVRRNFSDTSEARRILGWESNVPLNKGIEETVRWFFIGD